MDRWHVRIGEMTGSDIGFVTDKIALFTMDPPTAIQGKNYIYERAVNLPGRFLK